MAAYGTLIAWAKAMGHTEAARILTSILNEEKAADEKLSKLAEGGINREAAANAQRDGEDEGMGDSIKRAVFGAEKRPAAHDRGTTRRGNGRSTRKTASSRARARR